LEQEEDAEMSRAGAVYRVEVIVNNPALPTKKLAKIIEKTLLDLDVVDEVLVEELYEDFSKEKLRRSRRNEVS